MIQKAVEILLEPGAEAQLKLMGRRLGTKARSKVVDRTLTMIRDDYHISDVAAWFKEDCFAPSRRSTVRISQENADYVAALAAHLGKGRPIVLMGLIYFAASQLSKDDLESAA